jgi:hypothetical protein
MANPNLGDLEGLATSYEKCVTNTKFIKT